MKETNEINKLQFHYSVTYLAEFPNKLVFVQQEVSNLHPNEDSDSILELLPTFLKNFIFKKKKLKEKIRLLENCHSSF